MRQLRTSDYTQRETLSLSLTPDIHLTITWTSTGISTTSFTRKTPLPKSPHQKPPDFVANALRLLDAYFHAAPTNLSKIPLDPPYGTPFQHAVWRSCQTIPWGQTRSYAWLAARIRKPTAARAVGNALGRNPLPVLIPCHRVIRADGTLGGFGLGPHFKQTLLRLENPVTHTHPPNTTSNRPSTILSPPTFRQFPASHSSEPPKSPQPPSPNPHSRTPTEHTGTRFAVEEPA